MQVRITPFLKKLIDGGSSATAAQFEEVADVSKVVFDSQDPLGEELLYSPVKGLVHKYSNRVLWKVSYRCAAHCQFCTRVRQIGTSEGDLSDQDIEAGLQYVKDHPEVDDVILSGGDPLYTPRQATRILEGLSEISSVRVIRIGTRLPIHAPQSMSATPISGLLEKFASLGNDKACYLLLHINHPDELAPEVQQALQVLMRMHITVLSQTVFLRGINDDVHILQELFRALYYLGIIPYYIYRCDYVQGLERFVCDLAVEREIMTTLRQTMSGIAVPTYIADVPGTGKIPVPLGFWEVPNINQCRDFKGESIDL